MIPGPISSPTAWGERSIVEIADALAAGLSVSDLTFIDGTVFRTRSLEHVVDYEMLPSWEEVSGDKRAFAESFATQYRASDPVCGSRLVEAYPHGVYVVQNPPAAPLTQNEMDAVYRLPYARTWHPSYDEAGGVPALSEVRVLAHLLSRLLRRVRLLCAHFPPGGASSRAAPTSRCSTRPAS